MDQVEVEVEVLRFSSLVLLPYNAPFADRQPDNNWLTRTKTQQCVSLGLEYRLASRGCSGCPRQKGHRRERVGTGGASNQTAGFGEGCCGWHAGQIMFAPPRCLLNAPSISVSA
jgi:hypothetical protein